MVPLPPCQTVHMEVPDGTWLSLLPYRTGLRTNGVLWPIPSCLFLRNEVFLWQRLCVPKVSSRLIIRIHTYPWNRFTSRSFLCSRMGRFKSFCEIEYPGHLILLRTLECSCESGFKLLYHFLGKKEKRKNFFSYFIPQRSNELNCSYFEPGITHYTQFMWLYLKEGKKNIESKKETLRNIKLKMLLFIESAFERSEQRGGLRG